MVGTHDELGGRSIAITGAGSGLGRAYALAASRAGARVLVADIDERAAEKVVEEIVVRGGDAVALAADISAAGAGTRIVGAALAAYGRLDGFVANAGLLSPGPLLDQSEDTIRRTLAVNIDGTIDTVVAAARAMRAGGSIVVIVSGSLLGSADLALYGTTKAAALGLVYGLAVELEGTGIRITGLAPAPAPACPGRWARPAKTRAVRRRAWLPPSRFCSATRRAPCTGTCSASTASASPCSALRTSRRRSPPSDGMPPRSPRRSPDHCATRSTQPCPESHAALVAEPTMCYTLIPRSPAPARAQRGARCVECLQPRRARRSRAPNDGTRSSRSPHD
ncbi:MULTISPECIES: SDR family NAD(P)-dependent oxidoreductase [unclassified Microbacterium]|uniref:SDR family NAD(P)-dependent oxidoreductase n=1 Tax=unclassified Microbacterium TaxID=2609290 RepID=UPI00160512FE|nr:MULTISPECIES: SDR family oxidoreductase [unclassified Microbacterium]QNA93664.1 SDR family NAD(P)-dependent oxidoreductase [Microbacterium sp. Se63.02b]QYM63937.1 SDR family NAD(P)-dependent oxidoreductase [Microbacterium sp. Se5.02b]